MKAKRIPLLVFVPIFLSIGSCDNAETKVIKIEKEEIEPIAGLQKPINQTEVACEFFKNYMLVIREEKSLGNLAKPLEKSDYEDLSQWFLSVDFGTLSAAKKDDCDECVRALRNLIAVPSKKDSFYVEKKGRVIQKMYIFMVNFELTEARVIENGYPELADFINSQTNLAKMMFMQESKVNVERIVARPVVKTFSEYFVIFTDLFSRTITNERAALSQIALLSLHPEELANPVECRLFDEMHHTMLQMSQAIMNGENSGRQAGKVLAIVKDLMARFRITPEEVQTATSKELAEIAKQISDFKVPSEPNEASTPSELNE